MWFTCQVKVVLPRLRCVYIYSGFPVLIFDRFIEQESTDVRFDDQCLDQLLVCFEISSEETVPFNNR